MASKNKGSQRILRKNVFDGVTSIRNMDTSTNESYEISIIEFDIGELGEPDGKMFSVFTKGYMCCTYAIIKHQNIGYSHNKDGNNGNANDCLHTIRTYRYKCSFTRVETTVAQWKFKDVGDQMVNMSNAEDKYILEIVEQLVCREIEPNGKFFSVREIGNENGQQQIESQGFRESKIDEIHGIKQGGCDWMNRCLESYWMHVIRLKTYGDRNVYFNIR